MKVVFSVFHNLDFYRIRSIFQYWGKKDEKIYLPGVQVDLSNFHT